MKLRNRLLMFMILTAMLGLTLFACLTLIDRNSEKQPDESTVIPADNKIPASFKGSVSDEYGVPAEVMKTITDYMDAYYRSIYTLEEAELKDLFAEEKMAAVSEKAIGLLVSTRKIYDFDFSMNKAHYDLKVTDYKEEGGKYHVDLLEDDYFSFRFLNGIESSAYDIENSFIIDKDLKITDLNKVQGYYLTFYENDESMDKLNETYDYYLRQMKDLIAYNTEVLIPRAQKEAYFTDKRVKDTYDREAAVAYSYQYYHDRNPEWYEFSDEGGNCQNYASQAMLSGDIRMDHEGEEQWKCYVEDPDYEPYINDEETPEGRTQSWVNVGYFYNYARDNIGKGLVADVNVDISYAQPGDIIIVGNGGLSHTVIVSKVVDGHILVNSNSIDMKDFPIEAYTYTNVLLIKILGCN